MSDGTIHLPLTPYHAAGSGDRATPVARIIMLPENIAHVADRPLSATVISHDQGRVTLQTLHGEILVEATQPPLSLLQKGQQVQIRLQLVQQQAMLLELLAVDGRNPVMAEPVRDSALVKIPAAAADSMSLSLATRPADMSAVQARLLVLPLLPDEQASEMIVKLLSGMATESPLPSGIRQGFENFLLLARLLMQAPLLPQNSLQPLAAQSPDPQGILSALQAALHGPVPESASALSQKPPLLLQQTPVNLTMLQSILPGETVSPDILVTIRSRLDSVLQNISGMHSEKTPDRLYTMPVTGFVTGPAPPALTQNGQRADMAVFLTPQNQMLAGLVRTGDAVVSGGHTGLLAGTVIAAAFDPQTDRLLPLQLLPMAMNGPAGTQGTTPLALNVFLGAEWPALVELWQEALQLQTAGDTALMPLLRQTVPSPAPHHLPPSLLFFMAALKNGLVTEWLPQERLAPLGKMDTIRQLVRDMQEIRAALREELPPTSEGWRPLPVPLQLGEQLLRLQFFYRHSSEGDEARQDEHNKREQTRFILNVPQTRFGDIQIDGLVRQQEMDIILRTEQNLSAQAETAIRVRYGQAMDSTGMNGSILFQQGREHYIRV